MKVLLVARNSAGSADGLIQTYVICDHEGAPTVTLTIDEQLLSLSADPAATIRKEVGELARGLDAGPVDWGDARWFDRRAGHPGGDLVACPAPDFAAG